MAWQLSIENVAGIRRGDARLEPGVNAVRASNWQGKSSFLAGIETALGTAAPLTDGQDAGRVVLETDERAVTVELERGSEGVSRTGRPYLTEEYDRVCADLFAFLDEDNEVRRAVRDGENLADLLSRPLDFENIDERLADLRAERERVERELDRAEQAADRLPTLQSRVTGLEDELEVLRAERATLGTEPGDEDGARERLSDARAERSRVDGRIERYETTAERVRETLAETEAELDSLSVPSDDDLAAELERLHDELRAVERDRELLQSVYEANRRVLDEGRVELLTDVSHDVLSDSVTCWLCGGETTRDAIEDRLAALDREIAERRAEAADYRDRVAELEDRRDEIREARRRETDLESRIADLESRLAEAEESLEQARERRADLEARIDELTEAVDATEERVTDVESEIKYTEAELEDAREELERAETRAAQRSTLTDERESLTEEITGLRTRKEEIRGRAREAFSTTVDDLLERFDTGFETARLTGTFDLVVARDGRETGLDALSEGERELLGIVAALAGHEAFDVGERVPVLLLDGLGALASDNLRVLVEYLEPRVEFLVLTAYPEYSGFEANELSPGDWDVVSDRSDAEATP